MAPKPDLALPDVTLPLNRSFSYIPWLRLATALVLGFAAYSLIPHDRPPVIRATWGWDFAVIVLVGWILAMMGTSTPDHMRRRAARQDLGRWVILLAIIAGALVSMFALAYIQKTFKAAPDGDQIGRAHV